VERFKAEQPELHKQYLKEAQAQRRFLLKVKGPEACQPELLAAQIPALPMAMQNLPQTC
jgi:hypothetical protein